MFKRLCSASAKTGKSPEIWLRLALRMISAYLEKVCNSIVFVQYIID